jgi:glycosyltransferase involved in cell wall biosynthesis
MANIAYYGSCGSNIIDTKILNYRLNSNNIEEYALIFQKIDLLIFTSIADAAPQMIFESLLSGVPVVSFDVGYVNELIINKQNGFIVELYNTLQMTNKIIELVNLISTNNL